MKINIFALLIIATVINVLCVIFFNLSRYTSLYDDQLMGKIYSNSQYVKGPAATTSIGDDGLYSFAGYYLLFQGGNPAQVNFESPPLGTYLIGLSIWLFHNERVISLIYGILLLYVSYKLGMIIFSDKIVAALGIFLLSLEPTFSTHLISNLLDLPQELFITLALYFFIQGMQVNQNRWWISSLFWGIAVSNKFFPGIIFFWAVLGFWTIGRGRKSFFKWLITLVQVPIIYILSYFRFFAYNPSFYEFLRFHKWLLNWRLGNPYVIGNIFYSIFIGKYHDWWGANSLVVYKEWTIITPLVFLFGYLSIFSSKIKQYPQYLYLYGVCVLFLAYVSLLTTGLVKYLMPIFPILALFCSFSIVQLIKYYWHFNFKTGKYL